MKKATCEAIIHKDVRGKEQFYLKITVEGKEPILVNVGMSTYENVAALTEETKVEKSKLK